MNNDKIYLKHMISCIDRIEKSTKGISKKEFETNADISDATLRRVEVIGEAVKNISNETKNKNPQIEWKKISGTRDVLIHAYFSVDLDLVWEIVRADLPKLKNEIGKILKKMRE